MKIEDIEYIFGINQYKQLSKIEFNTKDTSFPVYFYNFELTMNEIIIPRNYNVQRHLYMLKLLQPFEVPQNTIITTAAYVSRILYAIIKNKENIIAIVDNSPIKYKKRFSNSDLFIQSYDYLKNCNKNDIALVCHSRKNDIIETIRKYNDQISILQI